MGKGERTEGIKEKTREEKEMEQGNTDRSRRDLCSVRMDTLLRTGGIETSGGGCADAVRKIYRQLKGRRLLFCQSFLLCDKPGRGD